MNKMITNFILCICSAMMVACGNGQKSAQAATPLVDSVADSSVKAKPAMVKELTFAFTGDVMMGTNVPNPEMYVTKDRGRSLFDDCREVLKRADLTIVNLEGTCYTGTEGECTKNPNSPTAYMFRMPGDHMQNLVDAGVDIVNFANNHSNDFGPTGRKRTLETLSEAGIKASGILNQAEGAVVERGGVRVGYVSFAASCTKVLDLNDKKMVEEKVKDFRKQCDILIVGFHGGGEGSDYQHVPKKREYCFGEDRGDVYAFAHQCVDLGADLVIGHGPHVPRAMELYKGHIIAYSLGNFCGPFRMSTSAEKGHNPLFEVVVNTADGTFKSGQIHSYYQIKGVGPRTDKSHAAAKDIQRLTKADFPDTNLTITDEGAVKLKQ